MKSLQTVHLLDNDPAVSRKLEHFLQHFGYTVTRHTSASDLLEAVNDADFSVVLADHAAVATAGLQLQAELAAGKLTCPVMFMAENADVKKPRSSCSGTVPRISWRNRSTIRGCCTVSTQPSRR